MFNLFLLFIIANIAVSSLYFFNVSPSTFLKYSGLIEITFVLMLLIV